MEFSLFPRDLFAEVERLQRQMQQALELSPSIRGFARGGFPALNVASTPHSAEIYGFAPVSIRARSKFSLSGACSVSLGSANQTYPGNLTARAST